MRLNYIVLPGTILKEYMNTRLMTQKELANITNSSERHISNVINGKVKITEEFALKLEDVFTDIKAEFWLELENKYRLNILRKTSQTEETLNKIAKDYQFKYVFKDTKFTLKEQADEMLKLLNVDTFKEAELATNNLNYQFMEDGGDKKSMLVWLKLCEEELDVQNDMEQLPTFNKEKLNEKLNMFKKIMFTQDFHKVKINLRKMLSRLGIALVILDAVPKSKIRGATTMIDNYPVIFLSTRYKRLDTFYFAFMHEISHILNEDYIKIKYDVSTEKEELEFLSNKFAREYFVNQTDYKKFIQKQSQIESITSEDIMGFANEQRVIPDIVIGFLEHDHVIDYGKFQFMKQMI